MALFSPDHSDSHFSPELLQESLRAEEFLTYEDLLSVGEQIAYCLSQSAYPYPPEIQMLLQTFAGKVKKFLEALFEEGFSHFRLMPITTYTPFQGMESFIFSLSFRKGNAMEQWALLKEEEYHKFLIAHEEEVSAPRSLVIQHATTVRSAVFTVTPYETLFAHLEEEIENVEDVHDVVQMSRDIFALTKRFLDASFVDGIFFDHVESLYAELLRVWLPESEQVSVHFVISRKYDEDVDYVDLSQLQVYEASRPLCILSLSEEGLKEEELRVLQETFSTLYIATYEDFFYEIDTFLQRFLEKGYKPAALTIPSSLELYRSCLLSRLEEYFAFIFFREDLSLTLQSVRGTFSFVVYAEETGETFSFFPTHKGLFQALNFFHRGLPLISWEDFEQTLFTVREIGTGLMELFEVIPYPSLASCEPEDFRALEEQIHHLLTPYCPEALSFDVRILWGGANNAGVFEYDENIALVMESTLQGHIPIYDDPDVAKQDQEKRIAQEEEREQQFSIGLMLNKDYYTYGAGEIISFLPFTFEEGEFLVSPKDLFDFLVRISSLTPTDE